MRPPYNSRLKRGISLVDILLSVFLFLIIITIILSAAATYATSKNSNIAGQATRIATNEIETLRSQDFDSLPSSGPFVDPNLSNLPQGSDSLTVSNYQSSPDIKLITVQVSWVQSTSAKSIFLNTLIYRNGLK